MSNKVERSLRRNELLVYLHSLARTCSPGLAPARANDLSAPPPLLPAAVSFIVIGEGWERWQFGKCPHSVISRGLRSNTN